MVKLLLINYKDLEDTVLSPKEIKLALEAWNDFQQVKQFKINDENIASDFMKRMAIEKLKSAIQGETMFQSWLYEDFSLDNEDDYFAALDGIKRELYRNLV